MKAAQKRLSEPKMYVSLQAAWAKNTGPMLKKPEPPYQYEDAYGAERDSDDHARTEQGNR